MRSRLVIPLLALTAAASLAAVAQGARTLDPNPANDPALISKKLDPVRYDGAGGRCPKKDPKGTRKLTKWLKKHTKRRAFVGTIRCDGGVHGTGRAIDIMLDARVKKEGKKAKRVIRTWMADDRKGRDNALARRMGVQLIIYDCKWWQAGDSRMHPYSACGGGRKNADPTQGHIDHIHVELTEPAAKLRTSFWKTELQGEDPSGDNGGGVSPSRATTRRGSDRSGGNDPFADEHPGAAPAIPGL